MREIQYVFPLPLLFTIGITVLSLGTTNHEDKTFCKVLQGLHGMLRF